MGKITWGLSKVQSGQLIRFRYNGIERVVIVMMCPPDQGSKSKTLLHGLQIQTKGIGISGIKTKLPMIIQKSKGVSLILDDKNAGRFLKFNMGFSSSDLVKPLSVYRSIRFMDDKKDLYRTFSWIKCKKSTVYLDNDELNEYNVPIDILADAGIIPRDKKPTVKMKPKTFNRTQRKARYKPGDVWKRPGGKWAGKSLDKLIRAFKTKEEAEFWSESTSKNYKVRQIEAAQRRSKKNINEV